MIGNLTVVSIYGKMGTCYLYGFRGEGTVSVGTFFECLSIMVRVFKNWRAPDLGTTFPLDQSGLVSLRQAFAKTAGSGHGQQRGETWRVGTEGSHCKFRYRHVHGFTTHSLIVTFADSHYSYIPIIDRK